LTKGSRVLVFGRLDIGHYQDKNGESRTSFDVWADDVQNMSARTGRDEESADGESRAPVAAHSRPTAPADPASEADDLDNLPF
jgi:single-stranded DNA-binding protein